MDAKSRANFINSVAGGQKRPCPVCNTLNELDSTFCMTCGNRLIVDEPMADEQEAEGQTPAKIICPSCHTANELDSTFCYACGARLSDSAPSNDNQMRVEEAAAVNLSKGVEETAAEDLSKPETETVVEESTKTESEVAVEDLSKPETETVVEESTKTEPEAAVKDISNEPSKQAAFPQAAPQPFPAVEAEKPKKVEPVKRAFQPIEITPIVEPEEISVFAQGLPAWDIVPPQVTVRRKTRK